MDKQNNESGCKKYGSNIRLYDKLKMPEETSKSCSVNTSAKPCLNKSKYSLRRKNLGSDFNKKTEGNPEVVFEKIKHISVDKKYEANNSNFKIILDKEKFVQNSLIRIPSRFNKGPPQNSVNVISKSGQSKIENLQEIDKNLIVIDDDSLDFEDLNKTKKMKFLDSELTESDLKTIKCRKLKKCIKKKVLSDDSVMRELEEENQNNISKKTEECDDEFDFVSFFGLNNQFVFQIDNNQSISINTNSEANKDHESNITTKTNTIETYIGEKTSINKLKNIEKIKNGIFCDEVSKQEDERNESQTCSSPLERSHTSGKNGVTEKDKTENTVKKNLNENEFSCESKNASVNSAISNIKTKQTKIDFESHITKILKVKERVNSENCAVQPRKFPASLIEEIKRNNNEKSCKNSFIEGFLDFIGQTEGIIEKRDTFMDSTYYTKRRSKRERCKENKETSDISSSKNTEIENDEKCSNSSFEKNSTLSQTTATEISHMKEDNEVVHRLCKKNIKEKEIETICVDSANTNFQFYDENSNSSQISLKSKHSSVSSDSPLSNYIKKSHPKKGNVSDIQKEFLLVDVLKKQNNTITNVINLLDSSSDTEVNEELQCNNENSKEKSCPELNFDSGEKSTTKTVEKSKVNVSDTKSLGKEIPIKLAENPKDIKQQENIMISDKPISSLSSEQPPKARLSKDFNPQSSPTNTGDVVEIEENSNEERNLTENYIDLTDSNSSDVEVVNSESGKCHEYLKNILKTRNLSKSIQIRKFIKKKNKASKNDCNNIIKKSVELVKSPIVIDNRKENSKERKMNTGGLEIRSSNHTEDLVNLIEEDLTEKTDLIQKGISSTDSGISNEGNDGNIADRQSTKSNEFSKTSPPIRILNKKFQLQNIKIKISKANISNRNKNIENSSEVAKFPIIADNKINCDSSTISNSNYTGDVVDLREGGPNENTDLAQESIDLIDLDSNNFQFSTNDQNYAPDVINVLNSQSTQSKEFLKSLPHSFNSNKKIQLRKCYIIKTKETISGSNKNIKISSKLAKSPVIIEDKQNNVKEPQIISNSLENSHSNKDLIITNKINQDISKEKSKCRKLFKIGDFIAIDYELNGNNWPTIWQIITLTTLKRYEPIFENCKMVYKSTLDCSTFTSKSEYKNCFIKVPVTIQSTDNGIITAHLNRMEIDCDYSKSIKESIFKYNELRQSFFNYVLTVVSQALDYNFFQVAFEENNHSIMSKILLIDNVITKAVERCKIYANWNNLPQHSIDESYHCICMFPSEEERKEKFCDICSVNNIKSILLFSGQPYNSLTLKFLRSGINWVEKDFYFCLNCCRNVALIHKLIHTKYSLYVKSIKKLSTLRDTNNVVLDTKEIFSLILNDISWLEELFVEFVFDLAEVDFLEKLHLS